MLHLNSIFIIENTFRGRKKMAQQLRVPTAIPEDSGLVLSIHIN